MSTDNRPRAFIALAYAEAAQEYLRSLPLEHFMEATAQATQRKITLESLDLVHARRPEIQVFNELLVQYPRPPARKPKQVVPDNMVVVCEEPIRAEGSYDVPLQPVGPFWMFEYVSKYNKRKDYEDSYRKYERELKVPYYLVFYPDNQELTLFHLKGRRYRSVPPDDNGCMNLPELDLAVGLRDGWVRFWYQGELLPLPADLQRDLDELRHQFQQAEQRAERAQQQAERAQQQAERAQQQAEVAIQQLEQEQQTREALERELDILRARVRQMEPPSSEA
jgi:Uma2 family endonuclease